MFTVYQHTNKLTKKSYIGFTKKTIEQRWTDHINNAFSSTKNWKFWNALRKYGTICWAHLVLGKYKTSKKAKKMEMFFIKKFNTYLQGYNSTLGGEGFTGKHSKKLKKFFSDLHTGQIWKKSSRQKLSFSISGEKHPNAKLFKLTNPDSKTFLIKGLKKYCRENQLPYTSFLASSNNGNKIHLGLGKNWLVQRMGV